MKNPAHLVSDPPHDIVDQHEAARCLGLSAAEAGLKVNFPAPEVWLADKDRGKLGKAARSLDEIGLRSVILEGKALLDVPPPVIARSVAFTKKGLVVTQEKSKVQIPYNASVLGVIGTPPRRGESRYHSPSAADWRRPGGSVLAERMADDEDSASVVEATRNPAGFVDLYGSRGGKVSRVTVTEDVTDFSAVPREARGGSETELRLFVEQCKRLFAKLDLDRRLENLRVRGRYISGMTMPYIEKRQLYSFGSAALADLLESVSSDLKETTQYDLGSRLSYFNEKAVSSSYPTPVRSDE